MAQGENLTQQPVPSNGHDAPIQSAAEDLYGSAGIARAIHRVLRSAPPAWSTRVALYGPWGSGKTSILNLLEQLETKDNAVVLRFSAWAATGEAGIIAMFYISLAERLAKENIRAPWLKRATRSVVGKRWLASFFSTASQGAEVTGNVPPGTTEIVTGAFELATKWASPKKQDIESLVQQLKGRRVVVFIDDLDRSDPVAIPKTLLALRELLDWPSFAFVLAFDKRVVGRALGEYSSAYGESAHAFLEKIIDFPFTITAPTADQQKELATHAFDACCPFVPSQVVIDLAALLPVEPRRVKLIARCISALKEVAKRHGQDEMDWRGLILHSILREANEECATEVANAALDSNTDLTPPLGDDKRKEWEKDFGAKLTSLYQGASPLPDWERTIRVAITLLQHWAYVESSNIRYQLELLTSEPPVTQREFNAFSGRLAANPDDVVVAAVLTTAQAFGHSRLACAEWLLDLAFHDYSRALSDMAEQPTSNAWKSSFEHATKSLSNLEYLWLKCSEEAVTEARRAPKACVQLIGIVPQWIAWTRNEGEDGLRARERTLGETAASVCSDAGAIYDATDPYFGNLSLSDALSAKLIREWRDSLRALVAPRIVEELAQRFTRPAGLVDIANGEPQILTWFLESPQSPIYHTKVHTDLLVKCLAEIEGDKEANAVSIQQNAVTYLNILLFQTRNASWGGADKLSAIFKTAPELVEAAWLAAVHRSVPFRMVGAFEKLRAKLVKQGVPETSLPMPEWLDRELGRLKVRVAAAEDAQEA